jgi:NIMA (never in mitosis gene a)-related kinase
VHFKDFKGNITDALNKIITDLKKFGYTQSKTLKLEQIKNGYGDQVCYIIDELLNLELYRREFQFH